MQFASAQLRTGLAANLWLAAAGLAAAWISQLLAARPGETHDVAHGEAPLTMVVALCATAALTVLMFFLPDVPLALAQQTIAR